MKIYRALILFSILAIINCAQSDTSVITGNWRFALEFPEGEIPFIIEISENPNGNLTAIIRNGEESLAATSCVVRNDSLVITFYHYDSYLAGKLDYAAGTLEGIWSRRKMHAERTVMQFKGRRDTLERFDTKQGFPEKAGAPQSIAGEWEVIFGDDENKPLSYGVFKQNGKILTGTFLNDSGDYRYLEGVYLNGKMTLSVFDGAHAFLFEADVNDDGTLSGNFWSRGSLSSKWTAKPGKVSSANAYELTKLKTDDGKFRFSFPDIDGATVTQSDPRFDGKALLVYIFGTWCPNCNDESALLAELYREYSDQGLEIVGLANEFTGDFTQDREMIIRYKEKHGAEWPILLVGIADKKKTAEAIDGIDKVISYPTTLFIHRDGQVESIYTGFTGPGTGVHYDKLKESFHENIKTILRK